MRSPTSTIGLAPPGPALSRRAKNGIRSIAFAMLHFTAFAAKCATIKMIAAMMIFRPYSLNHCCSIAVFNMSPLPRDPHERTPSFAQGYADSDVLHAAGVFVSCCDREDFACGANCC